MLKNAYFLAKIGADTAENEQHFAEILPIGRRVDRTSLERAEASAPDAPSRLAAPDAPSRRAAPAPSSLT